MFAAGADGGKPKLLMLGRLLSGISYEVIDIMTIPLTSPFFQVLPNDFAPHVGRHSLCAAPAANFALHTAMLRRDIGSA